MTSPLENLRENIAHRIALRGRSQQPEQVQGFGAFSRLSKMVVAIQKRFEGTGYSQPPPEKVRAALALFRQGRALSSVEWRLVFSALALSGPDFPPILDSDALFQRVQQEVLAQIEARALSRRAWVALGYSYFAYDADDPEQQPNWVALRELVVAGFRMLEVRLKQRKEWLQGVKGNWEVFMASAGANLGRRMFDGEINDLAGLQRVAQIPASSWLWRRVIGDIGQRLAKVTDPHLESGIDRVLFILEKYPAYRDYLLATCLVRYQASRFHDTSHAALKLLAMDAWGSPQLRSGAGKWHLLVPEDVCAMVKRWFAKEDLELFFGLIKDEPNVAKERLDYWMRFIGQIGYTRIVMGGDAFTDRSTDFVEFRAKNRDRISQLVGGSTANNAVMMQIGEYFLVEFSEIGNACYVFSVGKMPFDPEKKQIVRERLRNRGAAMETIEHRGPWQGKSDVKLQALGIFPDDVLARTGRPVRAPSGHRVSQPASLSGPAPSPAPSPEGRSGKADMGATLAPADAPAPRNTPRPRTLDKPEQDIIAAVRDTLKGVRMTVEDNRSKGGALWIHTEADSKSIEAQLGFLGFRRKEVGRYWLNKK